MQLSPEEMRLLLELSEPLEQKSTPRVFAGSDEADRGDSAAGRGRPWRRASGRTGCPTRFFQPARSAHRSESGLEVEPRFRAGLFEI